VHLTLADGDLARFSTTFANNLLTPPTRVFLGSVNWPAFTSQGQPGAFGGAAGELDFPFAQPWTYGGTSDIVLDFDFNGGALANQGAWGNATSIGYGLDGEFPSTLWYHTAQSTSFGTACRDSSQTADAGVSLNVIVFDSTPMRLSVLGWVQDQVMISAHHHHIGTDPHGSSSYQPSIHLIGLAGLFAGQPIPGIACARLHLDLNGPTFQFIPSDRTQPPSPTLRLPVDRRLIGLRLWYQAAWPDSVTGALRLTNGATVTIPDQPRPYAHALLAEDDPVRKMTTGTRGSGASAPILRYRW
jgi:hypothetical protein